MGIPFDKEFVSPNLHDKVDGLTEDLNAALDLMARVASGKQTVMAMGEWLSLNYPSLRHKLPKAMRIKPPKRKSRPAQMRGPTH